MKILITGVSGFVGRHLARYFVEAGNQVFGIARNCEAPIIQKLADQPNFQHQCVDLSYEKIPPVSPDVIIHAAAQSPYNCRYVYQYIESNVIGTKNIAEYAMENRTRLIVFLSGIAVFGNPDCAVINEESKIEDPDAYGASKYMAEEILKDYSDSLPIVTLRLPGVIGKGAHSAWLAQVWRKVIRDEEITIYNSSAFFNNAVYITDLAEIINTIINKNNSGYELITLGSDNPMRINEIISFIFESTGSSSIVNKKKVAKESYIISWDKAKHLYNYAPISMREILARFSKDNDHILSALETN